MFDAFVPFPLAALPTALFLLLTGDRTLIGRHYLF